jgi:hypothetical protein
MHIPRRGAVTWANMPGPIGLGGVGLERSAGIAPSLFLQAALPNLWVPKTSSTSCDQAVFVDQATDMSPFSDAVLVEADRFG